MIVVEIITIGNELLIGDVLDTNTHWLIGQITRLGAQVRRVTLVRDDPEAIGETLQGSLERGADVIFTSGGLGPTADDLTVAAIGQALGRPMAVDETALAMIERRYRELTGEGYVAQAGVTSWRRKMAILPEGAIPIFNPVGGAPAVVLRVDRTGGTTTVITLPGVPDELTGIFGDTLQSTLRELFGAATFAEHALWVDLQDESVIAGELARVAATHPDVYVKSRARRFGPGRRLQVTFSAAGPDTATVDATIVRAVFDLEAALRDAGISFERTESEPRS